jgi:hypothetical protein
MFVVRTIAMSSVLLMYLKMNNIALLSIGTILQHPGKREHFKNSFCLAFFSSSSESMSQNYCGNPIFSFPSFHVAQIWRISIFSEKSGWECDDLVSISLP